MVDLGRGAAGRRPSFGCRRSSALSSGELGNDDGQELIALAAKRLGEEIGRVVNLIDPDAVVVGGALGLDPRHRRQWLDVMRQSERHRPASFVPVIEAQFKTDAELVGAALASGSLVAA